MTPACKIKKEKSVCVCVCVCVGVVLKIGKREFKLMTIKKTLSFYKLCPCPEPSRPFFFYTVQYLNLRTIISIVLNSRTVLLRYCPPTFLTLLKPSVATRDRDHVTYSTVQYSTVQESSETTK